jgi:membrane-bound ClpP family serine protease
MDCGVGTLWVIYIVALIIFGIIFFVIANRAEGFRYSVAAVLTTLIAGIIVYAISVSNLSFNDMLEEDRNNLQFLYWVIFIIFILALIWWIVDIIAVRRRAAKKGSTQEEIKLNCDDDVCEINEVKRTTHNKNGSVSTSYKNQGDGNLALDKVEATDRYHHNRFKVKFGEY